VLLRIEEEQQALQLIWERHNRDKVVQKFRLINQQHQYHKKQQQQPQQPQQQQVQNFQVIYHLTKFKVVESLHLTKFLSNLGK